MSCMCRWAVPSSLTMTSEDVIHSFYMPAFRVKFDVLPGRYTTAWFNPTKPGKYHLFCAEYCGTLHSGMIGWIYVMEPAEYETLAGGRRRRRISGLQRPEVVRVPGVRQLPSHRQARPLPESDGLFGKPRCS